jgi:RNA polymerase sigma factor (TIGR02999 family)
LADLLDNLVERARLRVAARDFGGPEPLQLSWKLPDAPQGEITRLLGRWEQGEPGALESLAPLVYDQLHAIANALLRHERPDHTLQATAIVNEVFLDLLRMRRLALNDRAHFFTFAAQLTRRVLVDSARKAKAEKRGIGWTRIPLDAELAWLSNDGPDSLDLSAALEELEKLDASKTRAIELHYFLGCTLQETADILQLSKSTVDRSLRFALVWLQGRLRRR